MSHIWAILLVVIVGNISYYIGKREGMRRAGEIFNDALRRSRWRP